jgi:hypothetical protein
MGGGDRLHDGRFEAVSVAGRLWFEALEWLE